MGFGRWWIFLLLGATLTACGSGSSGFPDNKVRIAGQVEDGTITSPIGLATCQFIDRKGEVLAQAIADIAGEFQLEVPPESEGWIHCAPSNLPGLILSTYISTAGVSAGETLPLSGREEVSPMTTLFARQIAGRMTIKQ